ncbi:hypothetical protein ACH5RR_012535 [Cinchona calisaya]|uniref:Uncharacterized protein n=1 Tax=Cinchona calisaya TaxID=153742 RepID=A0ABD3A813_9GENT
MTPKDSRELLTTMAFNNHQYTPYGIVQRKGEGMHEVDPLNTILAQHQALQAQLFTFAKSLSNLNVNAVNAMSNHNLRACESYGRNRMGGQCYMDKPSNYERVHYVNQSPEPRPQNNPYSNTYNPGWCNHQNFSWSGNQCQQQQSHHSQAQIPHPRPPFNPNHLYQNQ